jgi:predicted transcriptional regulator
LKGYGLAIAKMAEEQLEISQQVEKAHARLDKAGQVVKQITQRLDTVEDRLAALPDYINERQARDVSKAVRTVAEELHKAEGGKLSTYFSRVFTALYEKFGVPSYKEIPKEQFSEVMQFLNEWKNKPDTPKQGNLF